MYIDGLLAKSRKAKKGDTLRFLSALCGLIRAKKFIASHCFDDMIYLISVPSSFYQVQEFMLVKFTSVLLSAAVADVHYCTSRKSHDIFITKRLAYAIQIGKSKHSRRHQ